jgi:hypothetical protein
MKNFTAADLQRLARGQHLPGEVFRAVFADPGAVEQLARLLQVRQLLDTRQAEVRELAAAPDMDVTLEELAGYGEGRSLPPERRSAVERFLGKHFPEGLVPPGNKESTC